MSAVYMIDTITEWMRKNVCPFVRLKVPPSNEDAIDSGYEYETANPVAFPMYVPTSEKLPPRVRSPFPSVCVGFSEGSDNMAGREGHLMVQLSFAAWNPGTHGKDQFTRDGDGWRDVWNFVDTALRALESTSNIGGYAIDQTTPIKYGPLVENEAIPNLYPFWFAWISFRINYPLLRNNDKYQKFL